MYSVIVSGYLSCVYDGEIVERSTLGRTGPAEGVNTSLVLDHYREELGRV